MCGLSRNLRALRLIVPACLTAVFSISMPAQSAPPANNSVLAVGTTAYGMVEGSDGNYYAMSLPSAVNSYCATDATMLCSYIYQVKPDGTLTTYHTFQPGPTNTATPANVDGLEPTALIVGNDGNLYGACKIGGPGGFGTIFKIDSNGTLTVLKSFGLNSTTIAGVDLGYEPLSLTQGADGNLYFLDAVGVYSVNPTSGAFNSIVDYFPYNAVIQSDPYGYNASSIMQASDGNFYLTMELTPGTFTGDTGANAGGIVQLTPGGAMNVVHTFALDGSEGIGPQGPLVEGPDGYLYGVTGFSMSGATNNPGLAFKVLPSAGGSFLSLGLLPGYNTSRPSNALIVGSDGNLYGTTLLGGDTTSAHCPGSGCGTLFRMKPNGTITVLHNFEGGMPTNPNEPPESQVDGAGPEAPLVQSHNSDFIGATWDLPGSSAAFFDFDLEGALSAPVTLTVSPTTAGINSQVRISWSVLNAFSDTAQNCGAVVQGGGTGAGNWSGRQTGTLANGIYSGSATITPTRAGTYTYVLVCGGNEAGFANLVVASSFQVTSLALPKGQVNVAYKATLTAVGGTQPYAWSVANMPSGLTLNAETGVISGTPSQFGNYSLDVTVTDHSAPSQHVMDTVSLNIESGLKITTTALPKATVGAQYNQSLVAQYGKPPYIWTVVSGTLPQGLNFLSGSPKAYFSGAPTVTGKQTVTFQVADSEANPATQLATFLIEVVPNVQIAAVEFTQAIQQFQTLDELEASLSDSNEPPVPMVAGKWTAMRVYFTALKDATNVTLTATGSVVGVKPFSIQPNCAPLDQRTVSSDCRSMDFYFIAPPGAWSTVLTLTDDQDTQLEQETLNVTSRATSSILYKAVSFCSVPHVDSSCQDPTGLINLTWFANKVLPTTTVTPSITIQRVAEARTDYSIVDAWENQLIDDVNNLYLPADIQADAVANQRTDYVGVYSSTIDDTGIGVLGGHGLIISNTATRQGVDASAQVLAHETGHTLGLTHTGTIQPPGSAIGTCWGSGLVSGPQTINWPFISNYLQSLNGNFEYGFDVAGQTVVNGSSTFDVMAYCMPRWISPYNYKSAFPELNGGNVTSANSVKGEPVKAQPQIKAKPAVTFAQGSYMQISGSLPSTGPVMKPIFTTTMIGTSDPGTGTYSIQEQGASGQVLYTRSFTPVVGQTDTIGTDFGTDPLFNEYIPVTAGTTAVAILDPDGNTLTTIPITGTIPTVAITSPSAGFVGSGEQTVSWTVSSGTATSFTSRVYYSIDGGTTWQEVLETTDSSETINFDTLPGAAAALIRVDASDGVNTGTATSAPFSVPKKLPTSIVINNPVNGVTLQAANPVYLAGGAYDPDDGFLSGAALQWSDNIQGNLGMGVSLPVTLDPGQHTITLTATDSDGNVLTATTEITLGGGAPIVTLTTAQSSGCTSAMMNAMPGNQGAVLTEAEYSLDGGNSYTSVTLNSLPFTIPHTGSGTMNVVAVATDASGQVSSKSQEVTVCSASTLQTSTGSGQNTLVGTAFGVTLSAKVADQNGNPIAGATVNYAAPASGASAALSAASAITNSAGIASITATANATAGAYSVTASTPNSSSTATFALTNSDFQIAASSPAVTVAAGGTGTDTLTLTPVSGFTGTANFSCSGLPAGVTCSFAPSTLTPSAGPVTTTMTIAASKTAMLTWPVGASSVLAWALVGFFGRRRKWFGIAAIFAISICVLVMTSCGGSTTTHHTAITSTVTVVAASPGAQRTTPITLTLQ